MTIASAAPPSVFDPILSYRWNRNTRFVRVANGEIVRDTVPHINNEGFHCSFDYIRQKPNDRTFRFIALGDSFTNDLALERAWPETLHHLLRSRPEHGITVEVYGMPTDGGGLPNWYTTLHEYVLPQFDFDGLIIADWGDDLDRDWVICHSTDTAMLWDRVDISQRPSSLAELDLASLPVCYHVQPAEAIDRLVARLRRHAAPKAVTAAEMTARDPEIAAPDYAFSEDVFSRRHTAARYAQLAAIVSTCRQRNVPVIYSPLPERGELLHLAAHPEQRLYRQAQGAGLCEHFGIRYFDGCNVFRDVPADVLLDFYWLKYDGHWAQGASTHYALSLAEYIIRAGIVTARPA